MAELASLNPEYEDHSVGVPYPSLPRQKCDLCLGSQARSWAIEAKMLRLLGDNGKLNDNMLMHILSPYPQHRSALSDCQKLVTSGFSGRKAILIFGYEDSAWPLLPAVEAFEVLATRVTKLQAATPAKFSNLVHPVHRSGCVFAWELLT
jgi:hypothetical protein